MVLEVDAERWHWLHGVMLQKKRVQVSKCCPELFGPLLCSFSSYGMAVLCLSFPALVLSPFLFSCSRISGGGGSLWQDDEKLQAVPVSQGMGTSISAPDFAGRSQSLRRRVAARQGAAPAASWCPLALPVPSGGQLARN